MRPHEYVGLGVVPCGAASIAHVDFRIGQMGEFFDRRCVARAEIGGCSDAKLTAAQAKALKCLPQKIHAALFDEGNQEVGTLCALQLQDQLIVELRFVVSTGEERCFRKSRCRPTNTCPAPTSICTLNG